MKIIVFNNALTVGNRENSDKHGFSPKTMTNTDLVLKPGKHGFVRNTKNDVLTGGLDEGSHKMTKNTNSVF